MADYALDSIARLKRRAKEIKRATGCRHVAALNASAREAGFDNYDHAHRSLPETSAGVKAPTASAARSARPSRRRSSPRR